MFFLPLFAALPRETSALLSGTSRQAAAAAAAGASPGLSAAVYISGCLCITRRHGNESPWVNRASRERGRGERSPSPSPGGAFWGGGTGLACAMPLRCLDAQPGPSHRHAREEKFPKCPSPWGRGAPTWLPGVFPPREPVFNPIPTRAQPSTPPSPGPRGRTAMPAPAGAAARAHARARPSTRHPHACLGAAPQHPNLLVFNKPDSPGHHSPPPEHTTSAQPQGWGQSGLGEPDPQAGGGVTPG